MKFVLYMAQTVNGMIARKDDSTPWSDAEWESYKKVVNKFGALVVGRRTFGIMKSAGDFKKLGNPLVVVVSSKSRPRHLGANTSFVKSPKEAVKLLGEREFPQALVAGGSCLNSSFMKEGLIDEMILDIEPLVFGRGIKLFKDNDFEARLKLVAVKKLSEDVVQLRYAVRKS